MKNRLIIVSNRLPYTLTDNDGEQTLQQSSGGLVSAVKGYLSQQKSTFDHKLWVGVPNFKESKWGHIQKNLTQDLDIDIHPVFITKDDEDKYYNGFCNSTIWPLFHYFPSYTRYDQDEYDKYVAVNKKFANSMLNILKDGDTVWIHDYHLFLLPKMLRDKMPNITIGYFLHIPFPSFEIFRLLPKPWRKQCLEGLLGADLIGFHTHSYLTYFAGSVQMILGKDMKNNMIYDEDRPVKADVFPISISYDHFNKAIKNKAVETLANTVKSVFEGKKILFAVDRLDYTKGIVHRLDGYEKFLKDYPEWKGKVVFLLHTVPSRDVIFRYGERKRIIEERVSRINGEHATLDWQPIVYRYNHLSFEELTSLYYCSNVGLITPIRDGMNLVAKEFIAAKSDSPGVLILSEMAGAANELSEAIIVNPTDTLEVSLAIKNGLEMDLKEQMRKLKSMQQRIKKYDVLAWSSDFFTELDKIKKFQYSQKAKLLDPKSNNIIKKSYNKAKKRLILLDYDGTLAPLMQLPDQASPSVQAIDTLKELVKIPENEVYIVSGRSKNKLTEWVGNLPVGLVAEHGAIVKHKNGDWAVSKILSTDWKSDVRAMMQSHVDRCFESFIEEKEFSVAWHYRNADPDIGFMRSRELIGVLLAYAQNNHINVIDGNKVLEVRNMGTDKGSTSKKIFEEGGYDWCLAIGDDKTDEDMFLALAEKAVTIKVGIAQTFAGYNLFSQKEVLPFLNNLITQ